MANIKTRVVDYDTDEPVQLATVEGVAANGTVFMTGKTSATGSIEMNNIMFDDPYSKIRFSKEGYATQTMRPSSANNVDVVLPKSNTLAAVTITLKQNKTKVIIVAIVAIVLTVVYFKYFKNKFK
jgi:hypothetical protein